MTAKLNDALINSMRTIANRYNHRFLSYSSEFVRQFGDQIDSRFKVIQSGDEVEVEASLWAEGRGTIKSDTIYSDVEDYVFLEEFDRVMKSFNKEFKKELIERDEDEEES